MANKESKELNLKIYGIIAFAVVAVFLVLITAITFKGRYTGFSAEKVAVAYVDTIAQNGDGYNAYKNSLLSKESKFGDFIRKNYINPVIYADAGYKPGDSTKGLKGLNDDSLKGEKTLNDDGTLNGQLIDAMYEEFEALVPGVGMDDYAGVFTEYIRVLQIKRAEIFGDNFFNDEVFFTCFEANLTTYNNSIAGCDKVVDEKSGVVKQEAVKGIYEEKYGEGYKITTEAVSTEDAEPIDLAAYGIDGKADECKLVTVQVLVNGEVAVKAVPVYVVKIGSTWYVANNETQTVILYNFYR